MEKTYEMLWDCEFCGTKKLLGLTHRHCPSCGSPQNPALRYFPSDAEKVAVQDHTYVGADRLCPACQAPSSAAAKHCGGCGAPLDGSKEVAKREEQIGKSFAGETVADATRERAAASGADAALAAKRAKERQQKPRSKKKAALTLGLFLLALVGIFYLIGAQKEARVRVAGHTWTRTVDIEKFGPVSDSSWCDSMPHDAYHVSRSRAVRSHRQVADGQECSTRRRDRGDGTFTESQVCKTRYRSEPVYDDRCEYYVDRWHRDRSVAAQGASVADTPAWPVPKLGRQGTCVGCEREGPRHETYTVKLLDLDSKEARDCDLPQTRWASMAVASEWVMDVGKFVNTSDCDSLRTPEQAQAPAAK